MTMTMAMTTTTTMTEKEEDSIRHKRHSLLRNGGDGGEVGDAVGDLIGQEQQGWR